MSVLRCKPCNKTLRTPPKSRSVCQRTYPSTLYAPSEPSKRPPTLLYHGRRLSAPNRSFRHAGKSSGEQVDWFLATQKTPLSPQPAILTWGNNSGHQRVRKPGLIDLLRCCTRHIRGLRTSHSPCRYRETYLLSTFRRDFPVPLWSSETCRSSSRSGTGASYRAVRSPAAGSPTAGARGRGAVPAPGIRPLSSSVKSLAAPAQRVPLFPPAPPCDTRI